MTDGLSDVQAVTCELMSRSPVDDPFRKKFSRTASLRDLPLGIGWGFAGLMLNRTGPTAAGACARAADMQNARSAIEIAFRQLRRCSLCGNRDLTPAARGQRNSHKPKNRGERNYYSYTLITRIPAFSLANFRNLIPRSHYGLKDVCQGRVSLSKLFGSPKLVWHSPRWEASPAVSCRGPGSMKGGRMFRAAAATIERGKLSGIAGSKHRRRQEFAE